MSIIEKIDKHLVNEKESGILLDHDGWVITNKRGNYELYWYDHLKKKAMDIKDLFKV